MQLAIHSCVTRHSWKLVSFFCCARQLNNDINQVPNVFNSKICLNFDSISALFRIDTAGDGTTPNGGRYVTITADDAPAQLL